MVWVLLTTHRSKRSDVSSCLLSGEHIKLCIFQINYHRISIWKKWSHLDGFTLSPTSCLNFHRRFVSQLLYFFCPFKDLWLCCVFSVLWILNSKSTEYRWKSSDLSILVPVFQNFHSLLIRERKEDNLVAWIFQFSYREQIFKKLQWQAPQSQNIRVSLPIRFWHFWSETKDPLSWILYSL